VVDVDVGRQATRGSTGHDHSLGYVLQEK
jgi:hypothetical protein